MSSPPIAGDRPTEPISPQAQPRDAPALGGGLEESGQRTPVHAVTGSLIYLGVHGWFNVKTPQFQGATRMGVRREGGRSGDKDGELEGQWEVNSTDL